MPTYVKAIYVVAFGACTLMYVGVKKKLANKMSNKTLSITISRVYYYLYLAVIVFVSRVVMAYALNTNDVCQIVPSFSMGLGSYVNYGLGILIKNQMYANVIINALLAFISCIIIKKILLNITVNDTVATIACIMYLLIPQSLVYVTEYIRYGYNVLFVLIGMLVIAKIIDEVQNFNQKNNKYLIYSAVLGAVQVIDIILGGSYVLWVCMLVFTALAAMYVDTVHMHISFKQKLNYKLKIFAEKLEKVNISKFVCVLGISLIISGIAVIICALTANTNNYQMFNVSNSENILLHSRTYYLVLVIFSLVFEIIGVILKRKLDVKMFMIKIGMITAGVLTFFTVDGTHASAVWDVLLVLTVITNVCNICYNREEKIKLLKDKN